MADKPDVKGLMRQGAREVSRRGLQRDVERAARAQAGNTETAIWLPVDDLTLDDAIQVRVGGVDRETVEQYAVVMFEHGGWGPFPPVDAHRDGDTLYLSAGFQRIEAARLASEMLIAEGMEPITEVPVNVRPGGYDAALEWSEEDNLRHGKPLSSRDKRYMFERRLERGHRWATMSDRAIARELGVNHTTVGRWRAEAEKKMTGANAPVAPTVRVGADGRTYDVSRVQAANEQRAGEPEPSPGPPPSPDAERVPWEPEEYPTASPDDVPPSTGRGARPPGRISRSEGGDGPEIIPLDRHELAQVAEALQDVIGAAHTLDRIEADRLDGLAANELDGLADLLVRAGQAMTGSEEPGRPVAGLMDRVEALLDRLDVLLYGEG